MGRRLEEYTHEELIEYIKKLKKQKRFGLVWEDKPENVVRECETKLPVVKEVEKKAIENAPGEPTNIIIEGDNYHALSVLNYTHAGKIDVIYIDPPYNTGNKDFIYNDCYVDKEDTFRHSKWLSFMEKRLRLAKNLLADDGVIFISIDDNEQAQLKMLCDSLFGDDNFVCGYVWQKSFAPKNDNKYISVSHEYILLYAKNKLLYDRNLLPRNNKNNSGYSNPDNDPRGDWTSGTCLVTTFSENSVYEIVAPNGKKHIPPVGRCWRYSRQSFNQLVDDNRIWFGKDGNGVPRVKRFLSEMPNGIVPQTWLKYEDVGSGQDGAKDLRNIFSGETIFSFPKPLKLMKYLIDRHKNKNGIILDYFAGTGTTGQAVMELNKEDGGHRQFILVTNNEANGQADAGTEGIAEKVTYPRIKTVITGVRPDGTKYSDGIPANLRYFKTDFVEKGKTTDDTREALITECCDMIRMRESAFEHVASAPEYRFYKNDKVFVPIIFDQFAIAETWGLVEKLNTEKLPVYCYNFSYNRHANEEEIPEDTELTWTACSIPETVLEVYRKIFRKKEA